MADEQPKRRRTTKASAATPKAAAKPKGARAPRKAAAPKPVEATPAPASEPAASAPVPAVTAKPERKPRATKPKAPAAPKTPPAKRASTATKRQTKARAKAPESVKAAAASATAAVERAVSAVKQATPEVTPRAGLFAAMGTAVVAAGAFFVWRASKAEEPAYQTIESDGPIEIRKYPPLVTAGTEHRGPRRAALEQGFRTLADYIFAKSRPGERLAMTAPVLSDSDGDGSWRTRFLMPTGKARGQLPKAPLGVELVSEPARRVAAIRFPGRAEDADLQAKENALRSWLQLRGLPHEGQAVHAFYNAPFLPGPLRRNEVMIVLSEEGGTGAD